MNAHQHLNDLLVTLKLPALEFDSNGCARMLFNGQVTVNFECDAITARLDLYSDLGRLPAQGCEALYRTLLEANLFGVQTRGATLSVDSRQNQVVLSRTVLVSSLGLSLISQILQDFIDCAGHWQSRLAQGGCGSTPALGLARDAIAA
jgi:hypothetical protein